MKELSEIFQTLITVGGGAWLFSYLKDIVKETFKKIDLLEKKIEKMEHEQEFKEKYKIKDGQ